MTNLTFRTFARSAVAAALLALPTARPAAAQGAGDARWYPWVGCWAPVRGNTIGSGSAPQLCVVPAGGASAEFITLTDGKVVESTKVDASGARVAVEKDGCPGWEQASFSSKGDRVFVRSELSCATLGNRATSAIIAMAPGGVMLQVQGLSSGAFAGVHATQYSSVAPAAGLPSEKLAVLQVARAGAATQRLIATRRLTVDDVKEATKQVESGVVETYLTEMHQGFTLDDKALVSLADANVPDRVIDLMVALSYPKVFTVNAATGDADFAPEPKSTEKRYASSPRYGWGSYAEFGLSPFGYSPFGYGLYGYSPFGYYGYGYGYGYPAYGYGGWYSGGSPVVIVRNDGGAGTAASHGRVVKGTGYSSGSGSSGSAGSPRTSTSPASSSSGASSSASSGSSSSGSSSSGSSSSSGGDRTAVPRKPPTQ